MASHDKPAPLGAIEAGGDAQRRLERLYRAQAPALQRRLKARVQSAEDASDLVHDAFARLLGCGSLNALRTPEAFLNRIVRNLLIDRGRRLAARGWQVPIDAAAELAAPAGQVDALEISQMREQYRAVVAALPARMREVFILHRIDGLSYREIGERLDISTRTVEWHIAEAIVRIAKGLDRQ